MLEIMLKKKTIKEQNNILSNSWFTV